MKKKYFKGTLREINGEQEYEYSYLIEASTLKKAEKAFEKQCKTWYDGRADK